MIDVHVGRSASDAGTATVLFTGDLYVEADKPFPMVASDVREAIATATLSVVNVEAPLVDQAAPIPKAGPHLLMHPSVARELGRMGFDVCSLANNHVMDHGWQGARATEQACAEADLRTVGIGTSLREAGQPCVFELDGAARVALFAVCESEFGMATDESPGTAPIADPELLASVSNAAADALVVVNAHGGNELVPIPSTQRREQLRRLVDAGAALVIGHHPHVAQGWEAYGGGWIFYSLGDFLFGADTPAGAREQWSYIVVAEIDERGVAALRAAPIVRRDAQLAFMPENDPRASELGELSALAGSSDLEGYWQEVAVRLHHERYRPFLHQALGVSESSAAGPTLRKLVTRLLPTRRSIDTAGDRDDAAAARAWSEALLLVLLRCESHRWAIETAAGVLSGDRPDRRTVEISRRVSELLSAEAVPEPAR
jgi:poly-gamma-glutamate capsule biosynthesis protein CapA/YwtB (metallophosphatase superfamily)